MNGRRLVPLLLAVTGVVLVVASLWAVRLAQDVGELRHEVSRRVFWMKDIQQIQKGSPQAPEATARLERQRGDIDAAMAADPEGLAALEAFRRGDLEAAHGIVIAVRRQTARYSAQLGDRWDQLSHLVALFVVLCAAVMGLLVWSAVAWGREVRLAEALRRLSDDRAAEAERRRGSAAVRSRRDLQSVIDAMPVGVAVMREGSIVFANPELARTLGVSDPQRLLGAPLQVDGPELETSTPVALDWDDAPASLVVVRDVSEWNGLQAQLRLADRLASVGTLATGVAHQINNPLAYVLGSLTSLERRVSGSVARDLLENVRQGAERVRQVVADLSTLARADQSTNDMTPFPTALLRSTARLATYPARHRVWIEVEGEGVPPVPLSEARLGQVLLNLLVNAVQAASSLPTNEPQVVRARIEAPGDDTVVVTIVDEGPGIPEEQQERLFDPFFTSKPAGQGAGLGLFICHQVVTGVGGTLEVTSEVGVGTQVRMVLPVAHTVSRAPDPAAPQATTPGRSLRLLVVDDEPRVAEALVRWLCPPHEAVIAESVTQARSLLGDAFDVILCDLNMPGEPGRALLDHLSADVADRVLFMTGGVLDSADREMLATRTEPVLDKPFDLEKVRAALQRVVARRGSVVEQAPVSTDPTARSTPRADP